MKKESCRKKRIAKTLFCGLIMAAMLVCLSGCRDRITSRDDADKEIADKTGTMAADYEKRREELDLGAAADPVMQTKNEEQQQKEEKQKEEKKEDSKESKDKNKKNSKTGTSVNGKAKGSKEGSGKGNGNGEGNGKGQRKSRGEGGKKNKNEEHAAKKVTVSFDANGGKCIPANETSAKYKAGSKYGSLPRAERSGHTFAGWFTEKEAGSIVNANNIVPGKNHILYAHWTKGTVKEYVITFDPCEGRIKKREATRQITEGSAYGQMPLPVKTGNDFLGWFTKKDGGRKVSENDVYKEKGNQTLYAHWKYDPYKYWSQMRLTIYESMYACQVVDCYIEFDDNKTAVSCSLLSDAKIGNCARNRGNNTTVTDEWVESRNPTAIIKCKGSSSQAASIKSAAAERFPGRRILVVPSAAVNGNEHEKLFYTLALGKAIYPSWFEEIDLDKAGSELGVNGSVFE